MNLTMNILHMRWQEKKGLIDGREEFLMSKYDSLWKWIQKNGDDKFSLTFSEIEKILK